MCVKERQRAYTCAHAHAQWICMMDPLQLELEVVVSHPAWVLRAELRSSVKAI